MGLAPAVLRLVIGMHRRHRFSGPALTLGVQDVWASYDDVERMCREERVASECLAPADRRVTTSKLLRDMGRQDSLHPQAFFRMLGIGGYDALDLLPDEDPSLLHDLNEPVPTAWHGRYGLVLDGGTIEHIFDVRATLANLVALLRVGGMILHVSPLSGWVNHGFFQFSPCLFYDFYRANGFELLESWIVCLDRMDLNKPGRLTAYRHSNQMLDLQNENLRSLFVFLATKVEAAGKIRTPVQGYYRRPME